MEDSFDIFDYFDFLWTRWKFPAFACSIALIAAVAVSLLLPKRYTATATILIDPPAGGDPRITTAVSTVYLESLKTYELLATNDQLFVRAVERFHLRDHGNTPIESLKRRVLKVDKLRDTRALQISVTLGDPKTAQAMVQFIADGAVELSRSGSREAADAMVQDAAKAASNAKVRLREAEIAWQQAAAADSEEGLRTEIDDDGALKSEAEEQLLSEQSNHAPLNKDTRNGDAQPISASPARIELLDRRIGELTRAINEKSRTLAERTAREENLEASLTAARSAYESAAQRLSDLPVNLGSRTEWLRVVDPGIVPQRPSSPNAPLIVTGAVSLALFGSLLYLTLSFTLAKRRRLYDLPLRIATHGDD